MKNKLGMDLQLLILPDFYLFHILQNFFQYMRGNYQYFFIESVNGLVLILY